MLRCSSAPKTAPGSLATLLQYRNKTADAALKREQLTELIPLCREHHVPLIVNDDLASATEALAQVVARETGIRPVEL